MRYISIAIVTLCLASASTASAQTFCEEISGGGTSNSIAMFTGRCKVGNSNIFQSPTTGNIGIGNTNPDSTLSVINFSDSLTPQGLQPYAIYGFLSNSTINFSSAIRGDSLATTGGGNGVIGLAFSSGGAGIRGANGEANGAGTGVIGSVDAIPGGGGGSGVLGVTQATAGFSVGVRGAANGTSGGGVGVMGIASSPNGQAGLFINESGGTILQGAAGPAGTAPAVFRVDSKGTVFADGGFRPSGADFAESLAVKGNREHYAPGDLLVIDSSGERRLSLAETPYSTLVAGIYSTQPGVVASQRRVAEALPNNEVPLAVVGIVPCKVSTENGAIEAGDLLVTSATPGHAMKGTDRSKMLGAVVGKALEPLAEGKGVIQVLVTLQ